MRSKVSSTLGLSSASIAESETEFSRSSSSSKDSGVGGDSPSNPSGGVCGAVEGAMRSRICAASASAAPGAVMSTFGVFLPSGPAYVASRSMMSRSRILVSFSSSRQMMIAWNVSGLSHNPAIIASRPASMRLAIAISPSRESSSTEPISRKYMRTGSSVRSAGSELRVATAVARGASTISFPVSGSSSSAASGVSFSASSVSSASTTLMP